MLGADLCQGADPGGAVVQAGDVAELFAACVQKRFACFHADFFQRFQAVAGKAGADHINAFGAFFGQFDQRGLGVRLQPFGLAKARLESDLVAVFGQAQLFSHQAGCFVAFAVVRVAQVQGALGHAMKAHDQLVGLAVGLPVSLNRLGQGGDVAGVVVVVVDEPEFRQPAHFGRPGVNRIKHAGRGGGAVLGIGGHDQHAGHALFFELLQLRRDRRIAVAHGVAHLHVVAQRSQLLAQHARLPLRPHFQRRALGHPDAGEFGG